ncbi:MAG: PhnA domain-containing protein [Methylophaga sp.]|nr:PhnA domain-containing protein [Methylophaga sp.]
MAICQSAKLLTKVDLFKHSPYILLGRRPQEKTKAAILSVFRVNGTSRVVNVGTKVKNIRLVGRDHNIDCKIDGIGAMKLKSQFVKKV